MVCWCATGLLGLVIAVTGYLFVKRNRKGSSELVVKNWKPGVVYVIRVPVSPDVQCASPFALKLESWLRLAKVKHEIRYSLKRGSRGQTPFVELEGEEYPDSNHIIDMLKKRGLGTDPDQMAGVKDDKEKSAIGHMARIMMESHTTLFGNYWRNVSCFDEYAQKCYVYFGVPLQGPMYWYFKYSFLKELKPRYYKIGIGRHTEEQREDLSCRDLKSLENIARSGKDKFFLGTNAPTSIDCTLFGHLAQVLYIRMDFPQKKFLHAECPQLVSLADRVRDRLWPDWEAACTKEFMEGRRI